jgi:hypothetical protein
VFSSPSPRYDRIVSLVFVVLIGLALVFLLDSSPATLRLVLGGDLPEITLSWLLIASLVLITSVGADVLARSHPQLPERVLRQFPGLRIDLIPAYWILPSLSIVSSYAFFRLFSGALGGTAFTLALITAGGLLTATLVAQHYSLDRYQANHVRAQMVLQIIGYVIAFGSYSAVYFTRYRTLYSATLIALSTMLLVYALLTIQQQPIRWWTALLIGLGSAELMWALNYWHTTFLLAGALLLTVLYVTVSLLTAYGAGQLQRRLVLEYALLGGGLFAVLAVIAVLR